MAGAAESDSGSSSSSESSDSDKDEIEDDDEVDEKDVEKLNSLMTSVSIHYFDKANFSMIKWNLSVIKLATSPNYQHFTLEHFKFLIKFFLVNWWPVWLSHALFIVHCTIIVMYIRAHLIVQIWWKECFWD